MGATKCFANFHMTMAEHSLWEVCRSMAYQNNGVLRFDGRQLARLYKGTDKNRIYRTVAKLIESGWFEVVKERAKNPKTGQWLSAIYRVLSVEEFGAKNPHTHQEPKPVPESTSPTGENGSQSHGRDRVQSQNDESPVPKNANPVPRAGHSSDVDTEEKNTETSSTARSSGGIVHLQTLTRKWLGETTQVSKTDATEIDCLEQRYGRKTVGLAYDRFLDNDKNLKAGEDDRTHLISYFISSGQAEIFAEEIKPLAAAGFSDSFTVEWLNNIGLADEAEMLTPSEAAWLEAATPFEKQYFAFQKETNNRGTLREFIARLGYQERPAQSELSVGATV